jgi:hypothetical protein
VLAAPLIKIVGDVMNRLLPPEKMTEKERADLEQAVTLEVMKADWQGVAGQMAVNAEEAKRESIFVSGWRPFIGWVCGSAFAYHFVLQPFMVFGIAAYGADLPPLPALDAGTLMPVLMGMLGLGGMRSFEKYAGVSKKR